MDLTDAIIHAPTVCHGCPTLIGPGHGLWTEANHPTLHTAVPLCSNCAPPINPAPAPGERLIVFLNRQTWRVARLALSEHTTDENLAAVSLEHPVNFIAVEPLTVAA